MLSQVVEETLRVANVAAMVHRVAIKDVEYGGYTIPQGWRVVVWLRSLHTDPNYYDDPLKFNPDRWEVSSVSPSLHTEHIEHRVSFSRKYGRSTARSYKKKRSKPVEHRVS